MTYFTQRQPVGKQVMSSNVINTRIQAIIQGLWLTLKIMFHTPNSPHICSPSFLTQKILLESWNATYIGSKISLFQTLPHRNFQQTVRQGKWKLKCFQKSLNSMNSSKGQSGFSSAFAHMSNNKHKGNVCWQGHSMTEWNWKVSKYKATLILQEFL